MKRIFLFLEVKDLSVKINGDYVIEDVSFDIEKGDIVAIIGPNGAGKTTLLHAIMGLIPYEGNIHWHSVAKIGYVPQRFKFDHTYPLTVEELFLLKTGQRSFWFSSNAQINDIKKALSHTGVEELSGKRVGELSMGQLQRVFIAYSLFGKPDLLLFDEPTAGIDIGSEMSIYGLLREINHELDITIVLVSHDLSIVYQYANNVICINRKMACFGMPSQVLTPEQLKELYGPHIGFYEHDHGDEEDKS